MSARQFSQPTIAHRWTRRYWRRCLVWLQFTRGLQMMRAALQGVR